MQPTRREADHAGHRRGRREGRGWHGLRRLRERRLRVRKRRAEPPARHGHRAVGERRVPLHVRASGRRRGRHAQSPRRDVGERGERDGARSSRLQIVPRRIGRRRHAARARRPRGAGGAAGGEHAQTDSVRRRRGQRRRPPHVRPHELGLCVFQRRRFRFFTARPAPSRSAAVTRVRTDAEQRRHNDLPRRRYALRPRVRNREYAGLGAAWSFHVADSDAGGGSALTVTLRSPAPTTVPSGLSFTCLP